MARLILKSPYIKGGARAVNYTKYIGTRERVELVPDGRPATVLQLRRHIFQIHIVLITEQAVAAEAFYSNAPPDAVPQLEKCEGQKAIWLSSQTCEKAGG